MLKKLTVEHYKGFYEEQTIEFSQPNENPGSGLTVIVGPNNAGKTTLLEALTMLYRVSDGFDETERHENQEPKITIHMDEETIIFEPIEKSAQIRKLNNNEEQALLKINLIPSRRYWHDGVSSIEEYTYVQTANKVSLRNPQPNDQFAGLLEDIHRNENKSSDLTCVMKKLVDDFIGWTIKSYRKQKYVEYITSTGSHAASFLGDGIISLFRIAAALLYQKEKVLVIDEPELSLHPQAQKKLAKLLIEEAKDRQIIICTHSPYFVSWDAFTNGAYFIRLNKERNGKCMINILNRNNYNANFLEKTASSWNSPYTLDAVAKEMLFSDGNILFVEGVEDSSLLKQEWKENMSFEIFGYGSRGYCNITNFMEMAKKLGFKKIAAIYDDGQPERKEAENTRRKFKNDKYLIIILPVPDIRDKIKFSEIICNCGKEEGTFFIKEIIKEGFFNEKGVLKLDSKPALNKILNDLNAYFGSDKEYKKIRADHVQAAETSDTVMA